MSSYALDKSNAKMLGVCAGLARSTGWDPTIVRVGAVAATLLLLGPARDRPLHRHRLDRRGPLKIPDSGRRRPYHPL